MGKKTVAQVLDIEQAASKLHADAEHEAQRIVEEAQASLATLRQQTLGAAQTRADEILKAAHTTADETRTRIVQAAEDAAQQQDNAVQPRMTEAVRFVLTQIIGQG